jgi:putative nucleotidyltransferase with HDIG domain
MNSRTQNHYRVMAVDDDPVILDLYQKILCTFGERFQSSHNRFSFDLTLCRQGSDAVDEVDLAVELENPFSVIFLDLNLPPGMDGVWTAEEIRRIDPAVNIVLVTGYFSTNLGENEHLFSNPDKLLYLQKPFHPQEIWQLATALSAKWRIEQKSALMQQELEQVLRSRKAPAPARVSPARTVQNAVPVDERIRNLALRAEKRDRFCVGHQYRVAQLSKAIAKEYGLDDARIDILYLASAVHDIGKISLPAEILCKPGKLSHSEYNMVKHHPQVGCDMLAEMGFPDALARIVRQHHERFAGVGYPQGLSGETILLEARILAVADVLDAMASRRFHRPAIQPRLVVDEIKTNSGTLYDPDVVDACVAMLDRREVALALN